MPKRFEKLYKIASGEQPEGAIDEPTKERPKRMKIRRKYALRILHYWAKNYKKWSPKDREAFETMPTIDLIEDLAAVPGLDGKLGLKGMGQTKINMSPDQYRKKHGRCPPGHWYDGKKCQKVPDPKKR